MMLTQIEDLKFASQNRGNPSYENSRIGSTRQVGEIARDVLIVKLQVVRLWSVEHVQSLVIAARARPCGREPCELELEEFLCRNAVENDVFDLIDR
jgi:hypothetical protein